MNERGKLIEDAAAVAQRNASMAKAAEADHADPVTVATALANQLGGGVGEVLGDENVIDRVVDAASGPQPENIPVPLGLHLAGGDEENPDFGGIGAGHKPRLAAFTDDRARV